jgi:tetratricopeptide (TPR) repeat protein
MIACLGVALVLALGASRAAPAAQTVVEAPASASHQQLLAEAHRHFYSGRYEAAAELTLPLRAEPAVDLAAYELRTSAIHFHIKRLMGEATDSSGDRDKDRAFKECGACPGLMKAFLADIAEGRQRARDRLKTNPGDEAALFFLGKIDLNYVWLQLGTLGRRTGWDEYWEARKSLDQVLKRNPQHVRARVARAWIDYIVDTRMPWGTGWILGGGNKKKALAAVREAANIQTDAYVEAEADFALWDLHVRERRIAEAIPVARQLAEQFPDNKEIARFLELNDSGADRK